MDKIFIKKNNKLLITLSCFFFLSLLYNIWSPYTTDDYTYMYSFATGERITSLFQVFPSMAQHYMSVNGRTVSHFLVQIMLMFPKMVFNTVNAAIYTIFLYFIYKNTSQSKEFRPIIFVAIAVCVWVFTPVYGQVFLWVTGSINYYWSYFFALIFLSFYLKIYRTERELSKIAYISMCVLGFFFGGYSENTSFSVIFMSFVLLVLTSMKRKDIKFLIKYTVPVVLGAIGYLTILFSPANSGKIGSIGLSGIIHNVIDLLVAYYTRHYLLLIIFAVLFVIALHYKVEKKECIIAVVYLGISVVSVLMLCVTSYLADRSLGAGAVFLIIADIQLMQSIRTRSATECIAYCLAAYLIVSNVLSIWDGSFDIYDVYRKHTERENYISQQIEAGEKEVTVTIIYPMTKYSCKYILTDLNTKEQEYGWPNGHIAKYYGLEKIYGKNPW